MTDFATSSSYGTGWKEVFWEDNPAAEARLFATFSDQIKCVQEEIKENEHAAVIRRAFHAKMHVGVTNAEFRVLPNIAEDLRIGLFQPGATYSATVRFSSANGGIHPDTTKDLHGAALRVVTEQGNVQDFLMTDASASHARDARQFMVAAEAMTSRWKIITLLKLLKGLGVAETWRMIQVLSKDSRKINSLATDQFWSRAPIKFGPYAVKFTLRPSGKMSLRSTGSDKNYLREDFIERLLRGPLTFDFGVQKYVDEVKTPIEDGSVEWKESDSPFKVIAQLVIPQQDLRTASAKEMEIAVDQLKFNPWNTTEDFRPLGNLNRARLMVYEASADYRAGRSDQMKKGACKMNRQLGRWILSLIALFTAVFPFIADMNETHMFNPRWESHAKYHCAQTIVLGTSLGLSSLYFLWRKKGDQRLQLQIATLLASLFWIAQVGSIFFPGTAFFDPENKHIPQRARVFLNQGMLDAVILPLTVSAYCLEQQRIKESKA